MPVNIQTGYAGEVLEQLLVRATTGNELVAGGHIRVQPNVEHKFFIPRLRAGKMLQKRKEQPDESNSQGNFNIDEKVLEPKDFMAFTTFNPRVFEHIWRPFQPTGNLVFSQLPVDIQNQLLAELAKVIDFELGYHFVQGVEGNGDDQFFNGIVTRIAADSEVLKVTSGVASITKSNVLDILFSVRALIPKAVRRNPNLKIFMSQEDFDVYENTLTALPNKGANYTDVNPERFKGIPIVVIAEWPKDVIVAAVTSTGLDSNFWAAVNYVNDSTVIEIDKLTNAGEKYFFKMLMKADTNIAFGEQIVLFDARSSIVDSDSTDLSALVLSAGALTPAFNASVKNYTLDVASTVANTTVTATQAVAGQVIKVNNTVVASGTASGAIALAEGENDIVVTVKSLNGLEDTYTIVVTKA